MVGVRVSMADDGVTFSFDASNLNDHGIRTAIREAVNTINEKLVSDNVSGTDLRIICPRSLTVSVDPDTFDAVCTAPYLTVRIRREPSIGPPRMTVHEEGRSTPSALAQGLHNAANEVLRS